MLCFSNKVNHYKFTWQLNPHLINLSFSFPTMSVFFSYLWLWKDYGKWWNNYVPWFPDFAPRFPACVFNLHQPSNLPDMGMHSVDRVFALNCGRCCAHCFNWLAVCVFTVSRACFDVLWLRSVACTWGNYCLFWSIFLLSSDNFLFINY